MLVGFVAMAVALGDHVAVDLVRQVPGLTSELCAPSRIVPPRSDCALRFWT